MQRRNLRLRRKDSILPHALRPHGVHLFTRQHNASDCGVVLGLERALLCVRGRWPQRLADLRSASQGCHADVS